MASVDTGVGIIGANANEPAWILVEDITPTPAPANSAPSSTLAYAEVTTNQGSITTEVDITGLAVTVIVPAGRRLRITGQITFSNTGANQNIGSIKEGGTFLGQHAVISGAANTVESMHWSAVVSPSAGTHTYKLTFQATSGTATTSTNANNPISILVEDITPASIQYSAIVPGSIVCTAATRPSSPAVGTQIYEIDTGWTRIWNGTNWTQQTPLVATSSSRPASPTNGVEIYETDTGLMKYWNGSNWITETNMKMFNVGATLAGTAPAIDTGSIPFKIQCATVVATTDASGVVTVTFPSAFPNGLVSFVVCQGGNTISDAIVGTSGGSASGITLNVYHGNGTVVNGGLMRFNYIAIGW
jgi:hypothetical protein